MNVERKKENEKEEEEEESGSMYLTRIIRIRNTAFVRIRCFYF